MTGSVPDSEVPGPILTQQQAAGYTLPRFLVMDAAGGWGRTREVVQQLSGGQTQLVAPLPTPGGADANRLHPAAFTISADGLRCTCPNNVTTTRRYRTSRADGWSFRFLAKECQGCPLWSQCRDPKSKPTGHRNLFISDYHHQIQAAAEFNALPLGVRLLRTRWPIEPTIAWLVRYDGARRCRRVGQEAAQFQLYQAAAGRNLWSWLARRQRATRPAAPAVTPVAAEVTTPVAAPVAAESAAPVAAVAVAAV